jgi:glutathione reductase (NADPH)
LISTSVANRVIDGDGIEQPDLLVVGAGSAGVRASRIAAERGARVTLVEADRIGGTCVLRGCVPKKLLTYAARVPAQLRAGSLFGWELDPAARLDWAALLGRVRSEVTRLEALYTRRLTDTGVTIVKGTVRLLPGGRVGVGDTVLRPRQTLLAVGAAPHRPDFPGASLCHVSDDIWSLPRLPEHVLIVGGGYVALEFASVFLGMGRRVTLVHRSDRFLRDYDQELPAHLLSCLAEAGLVTRLHSTVRQVQGLGNTQLRVTLDGPAAGDVDAGLVLLATGRMPSTAMLNAPAWGLKLGDQGEVLVDARGATSVEGVFAAGDCTRHLDLTPVAIREGHLVAGALFGDLPLPIDYDMVPRAVFTDPPLASAGLSEQLALERGHAVKVYRNMFRPLVGAFDEEASRVLVKLVVDAGTGRVLGAHMVGTDAPEIMQGLAIAIRAGLTKADFDRTLGIHPTVAEEFVTLR